MQAFEILPPEFHELLREGITTSLDCASCVEPLCSCSGAHSTASVLLPGEKEWFEAKHYELYYPTETKSGLLFEVCGDCTLLAGKVCQGHRDKSWDCLSFPLQPMLVGSQPVPFFAKNCTIHPGDLDPLWIHERWQGWLLIARRAPEWFKWYTEQPIAYS